MKKIYFFIGTKAQAIKCLPLIDFLSQRQCNIAIVDSGQHIKITKELFKNLSQNVQHINLSSNQENISKYFKGIIWLIKFIRFNIIPKTPNRKNEGYVSICVVHGDTVSTLLGLLWAKRNYYKVLHLESGLTSKSILIHFPEEIIIRITSKFSDILICFDNDSYDMLASKYKYKKIFKASENTIVETLNTNSNTIIKKMNIVTATLHRTENLLSKKRLESFIKLLEKLSERFVVNWYMHEPTINAIEKFKMNIGKNINTHNLLNHEDFVRELKKSKIVITDGGSIQEECFYLGNTTLIWRQTTERPYALNDSMYISSFDIEKSYEFIINNIDKNRNYLTHNYSPSEEIYTYLLRNNLI